MATPRFRQKAHLVHTSGKVRRVTKAGIYQAADGTTYRIPVGFLTDGASVPRFLWSMFPPFAGDYEPAAILHDVLYQRAEQFEGEDHGHLSRSQCDDLMQEAMTVLKFTGWGQWMIYRGVRMGGWKAWRQCRAAARQRAT
jgi:hypothetical protein